MGLCSGTQGPPRLHTHTQGEHSGSREPSQAAPAQRPVTATCHPSRFTLSYRNHPGTRSAGERGQLLKTPPNRRCVSERHRSSASDNAVSRPSALSRQRLRRRLPGARTDTERRGRAVRGQRWPRPRRPPATAARAPGPTARRCRHGSVRGRPAAPPGPEPRRGRGGERPEAEGRVAATAEEERTKRGGGAGGVGGKRTPAGRGRTGGREQRPSLVPTSSGGAPRAYLAAPPPHGNGHFPPSLLPAAAAGNARARLEAAPCRRLTAAAVRSLPAPARSAGAGEGGGPRPWGDGRGRGGARRRPLPPDRAPGARPAPHLCLSCVCPPASSPRPAPPPLGPGPAGSGSPRPQGKRAGKGRAAGRPAGGEPSPLWRPGPFGHDSGGGGGGELGGSEVTLRHFLPLSPHLPKNARHAWKLAQRTKNVRLGGWNELPPPPAAEGGYCPCPPGAETRPEEEGEGRRQRHEGDRSTRASAEGRKTSVTWQRLGTTRSTEQHFAEFNFRNYFASPGSSLLSTPTFLTYQRVSKRRRFGLTFTIASKEYDALSKLKSTTSGILYKVESVRSN